MIITRGWHNEGIIKKVLSRKEILEFLKSGDTLLYYSIYAKIYVENVDGEKRGAVRFDTYLKLMREGTIKRLEQRYLTEIYALA